MLLRPSSSSSSSGKIGFGRLSTSSSSPSSSSPSSSSIPAPAPPAPEPGSIASSVSCCFFNFVSRTGSCDLFLLFVGLNPPLPIFDDLYPPLPRRKKNSFEFYIDKYHYCCCHRRLREISVVN